MMSQISVVHYNPEQTQKVNILQQNTDVNNGKSNERKIIVLRKPPTILPQPQNYNKNDILLTNPGRKNFKKSSTSETNKSQPTAVARRNARERNRVKQVNNGFATLRQRIPSFIAQAYESNSSRSGNKKLSKVETLRMAVEYIRSLEEILAMDGDEGILNLRKDQSNNSYHNNSNNSSDLSYSVMMSPSEDDDNLSTISTPPPQQYIRINPVNNTYEIVSTSLLDNSENLDPMSIHDTMLTDSTDLDFSEELSYLHVSNMQANGSLSPEVYSEPSLSPAETKVIVNNQNCFIPVFDAAKLGGNFNVHIKSEKDFPVISLKTEQVIPGSQKEFADVINWWESNPQTSVGS